MYGHQSSRKTKGKAKFKQEGSIESSSPEYYTAQIGQNIFFVI